MAKGKPSAMLAILLKNTANQPKNCKKKIMKPGLQWKQGLQWVQHWLNFRVILSTKKFVFFFFQRLRFVLFNWQ